MTVIAIFPLLILITVVIVLLLYFVIYNRRINRQLREEESTAHISMASMDSVSRWVIIIAAALLLFSIHGKITSLADEQQMTRSALEQEISYLQGQVSDLEQELSEQNSLITAFDYELSELDPETMTSKVTLHCTPKSYGEDTEITVSMGNYEIPLTRGSGGIFTGSTDIGIFEALPEEAVVTITTGGISQTQTTDQQPYPFLCYEALPWMDVYCAESEFSYTNGTCKAELTVENSASDWFHDLTLIVRVNGTETERHDLTMQTESFSFSIPSEENDSITIYATGVDEYGLTHEIFLSGWEDESYWTEAEKFCTIYDADGNLLFDE